MPSLSVRFSMLTLRLPSLTVHLSTLTIPLPTRTPRTLMLTGRMSSLAGANHAPRQICLAVSGNPDAPQGYLDNIEPAV